MRRVLLAEFNVFCITVRIIMSFTTTSEWREGRRDGGTEGRRDGGTEGRRDGGTEGRRDGGTEGGNGSISVMKVRIPVSLSYVVWLCACVRAFVRAYVRVCCSEWRYVSQCECARELVRANVNVSMRVNVCAFLCATCKVLWIAMHRKFI